MTDPYCRYCGLPPLTNPGNGCRRHPAPPSELERLSARLEALEADMATILAHLPTLTHLTTSTEVIQP
jgi:hypothetical protein